MSCTSNRKLLAYYSHVRYLGTIGGPNNCSDESKYQYSIRNQQLKVAKTLIVTMSDAMERETVTHRYTTTDIDSTEFIPNSYP